MTNRAQGSWARPRGIWAVLCAALVATTSACASDDGADPTEDGHLLTVEVSVTDCAPAGTGVECELQPAVGATVVFEQGSSEQAFEADEQGEVRWEDAPEGEHHLVVQAADPEETQVEVQQKVQVPSGGGRTYVTVVLPGAQTDEG